MARDHAVINLNGGRPSGWRETGKTADWFVYAMYESQGRVKSPLYVGVTKQLYTRLAQHRRVQAWWPLVGRIAVQPFASQEEAYEAEERLIYLLRPLFNSVNNIHAPTREVTE